MMNRAQKAQEIAGLADRFGRAKAAFLVDYKGINVEQMTQLRKSLRTSNSELLVVKNTLARKCLSQFPEEQSVLGESLIGTNAFVFAFGEVNLPAKILNEFGSEVEALELKSGVMLGRELTPNRIRILAALPAKEVLQAQLLGTLGAPMSKFVRVLNEVPGGFVRLLASFKAAKESAQSDSSN